MKEVIRCKINEKHRQFNNFKTRHSSSTCSAVLLVAGYPPGCSPSCSTQWTDQKRCGAVLFQGSSTKHGKMEGCSLPSNPSRNRKTSWIFQTWSHRLITESKARAQMNRSLVSRLAVEIFSGLRMMRSGLLLLTICLGCRSTDRRDSEKKSRTSPLRSLAVSFQPHNNHQSNWQRLNSNNHQEKTSDSFVMPEETSSTRRYLGTTGAALGRSASAARFVIEGSKSNVAVNAWAPTKSQNAACENALLWNPTVHDRLDQIEKQTCETCDSKRHVTGTCSMRATIHHPSQPGRILDFWLCWKHSSFCKRICLEKIKWYFITVTTYWSKSGLQRAPPHPLKWLRREPASECVTPKCKNMTPECKEIALYIYIIFVLIVLTLVSNVFNWLHIFLHAGCEALSSRPGPADAHCERAQGKLYEVVIIVLIGRSNVRAVLPQF